MKPVIQVDTHIDQIVASYPSVEAASSASSVAIDEIEACCAYELQSAGGWRWMFEKFTDQIANLHGIEGIMDIDDHWMMA